jgi:hypothetical protein
MRRLATALVGALLMIGAIAPGAFAQEAPVRRPPAHDVPPTNDLTVTTPW